MSPGPPSVPPGSWRPRRSSTSLPLLARRGWMAGEELSGSRGLQEWGQGSTLQGRPQAPRVGGWEGSCWASQGPQVGQRERAGWQCIDRNRPQVRSWCVPAPRQVPRDAREACGLGDALATMVHSWVFLLTGHPPSGPLVAGGSNRPPSPSAGPAEAAEHTCTQVEQPLPAAPPKGPRGICTPALRVVHLPQGGLDGWHVCASGTAPSLVPPRLPGPPPASLLSDLLPFLPPATPSLKD